MKIPGLRTNGRKGQLEYGSDPCVDVGADDPYAAYLWWIEAYTRIPDLYPAGRSLCGYEIENVVFVGKTASPKLKCHLFSKIEMSPAGAGLTFLRLERGVAKPLRQG
jgi:hypothetical protein